MRVVDGFLVLVGLLREMIMSDYTLDDVYESMCYDITDGMSMVEFAEAWVNDDTVIELNPTLNDKLRQLITLTEEIQSIIGLEEYDS